jgi:hypothetical protein
MSIPNGYGPAGYAAQRLVLLALAWAMALAAFPAWAQALPTLTVDYEPVARERHFDGLVEAERRSTVSAQVSARIEDLPFDVDDYVERGDVIVRFRDQQAAADLKQAEAASLEARARLEESRSNYDRIARLFEQQRVSQADMDRATADQQSARARVEAAEGALLSAQENYENTLVRAPFAGIVVERHCRWSTCAWWRTCRSTTSARCAMAARLSWTCRTASASAPKRSGFSPTRTPPRTPSGCACAWPRASTASTPGCG